MSHGAYLSDGLDQFHSLQEIEGGTLRKLYICNKAAIGCLSSTSMSNIASKDGFIDKMYKSISTTGCVLFDEILEKEGGSFFKPDCRMKVNSLGTAMINRVSPNIIRYINKGYSGNTENYDCILDLETYQEIQKEYTRSYERSSIENIKRIFKRANLINDERLHKTSVSTNGRGDIIDFTLELKDLLNYYSTYRGKRNIFIYDTSCSVWADLRRDIPNYDAVVNFYTDFQKRPEHIEDFEDTKRKLHSKIRKMQLKNLGGSNRKRTRRGKSCSNRRKGCRKTKRRNH
jgi:thiamine phosphate synthase YjbQ (UPF0047 family)